jgi:hypothetical protein
MWPGFISFACATAVIATPDIKSAAARNMIFPVFT